jgi:leucyl/phenylalanyl-tRNA--protein transferase
MPARSFGNPNQAPARAPLAVGGSLDVDTLLLAYRSGVFPWYSADEPVQWWSPDPRFVLLPEQLRVTDSLTKVIKKSGWKVTYNQSFTEVMQACAEAKRPGQDGTWITPEMIEAYTALHCLGHAHSVEVHWEGKLVGGLYGVSVGAIFHGESMFFHRPNASKVGFVTLVQSLKSCGYQLIDCQMPTEHLASFGAISIRRRDFLTALTHLKDLAPEKHPWSATT